MNELARCRSSDGIAESRASRYLQHF